MNERLKLLVRHGGTVYDAAALCGSISNAGSYNKVARTLDFSLLQARYDKNQPAVPVGIGDNVQLFVGSDLQFDGYVFSLRRDSGGELVNVGCADRGIYLKQNQASYRFSGQTPEQIAQRVCGDFGLQAGRLARTGVPIRRNFPGASLYQIIQTAYTLAARETGERYMLRFRGAELEVIVREQRGASAVIAPGSNLLTATAGEDARQMVSQVAVYAPDGSLVRLRKNEEAMALCGCFQRCIQTSGNKDVDAQAAEILEDNDVRRTVTVEAMGDHTLIAGGNVIVREPVTGLYGLYWIDSDTQTWKGGVHRTRLELNLRRIMDKVTAGKELEK